MSTQSNFHKTRVARFVSYVLIACVNLQPLGVAFAQSGGGGGVGNDGSTSGLLELFDQPHLAGESIPPYVMIAASKDQQLFKKAYDDYSDLDDDGKLDTTYKHSIDYYGYFDSYKCYNYSDANRRYEPASISTTKYCSGNWSGNFLNWASMTRVDALRKVMFGGLRSPTRSGTGGDADGIVDGDQESTTVLERSFLPHTAHAFTKYYDGADLNQLTPFDAGYQTTTGTSVANSEGVIENGIDTKRHRVVLAAGGTFTAGDIVELKTAAGSFVRGAISWFSSSSGGVRTIELQTISAINISGTAPSNGTWTVNNLSRRGITICNTTNGASSGIQGLSNTNTNLPRMKIARGNWSIWNASERWQCTWSEERNAGNGNNFAASGIPAYASSPSSASFGLDYAGKGGTSGQGSYFVRTQVCVDGLQGKERCKAYPNGKFKPVGLLQVFGETDRIRFGLLTGSYLKNISGGVLRKNVSKINDEVNLFTGQFYDLPDAGVGSSQSGGDVNYNFSGGSIIKTLSLIRMTGYEYNSGNFFGGMSDDSCSYQRQLNTDGACRSWGNPISEMFYEVLRYYGGQTTASSTFSTDDTSVVKGMARATWPASTDAVLSARNYCAPVNALVINAATNTNEADNQIGSLSFMAGSPSSAREITNQVGSLEGLSGNYYMGARVGDSVATPGFNSCTGKSMTGLGNVIGICPEGPTYGGSYQIAGLAYYAHVNKIRTDLTLPASASRLKRPALQMDTYGVSLSSGVPRIPIKFAGDDEPKATLQPSYRLVTGGAIMGGALVDLRVLFQKEEANRSTGRIFVSFEDSEGGGDYDMDVWGIMTYELLRSGGTTTLSVTTDAVYQATGNPQGFGYIIAGTDRDGQHFHSGIHNFSYNDATPGMTVTGDAGRINASGGCNGCQVGDGPSTASYVISESSAVKSLEEPLYYAAKFGGFEDSNKNKRPDSETVSSGQFPRTEFDRRNNKTGADEPDGIPDNYYKVSNPLGLEVGLERTFQLISEQTSLSAVSSSSTRVRAGNLIYEAKFNSGDWSGELEARVSDANGQLSAVRWNASSKLGQNLDHNSRKIITISDVTKVGTPFNWASITPTQKASLDTLPGSPADGQGQDRLEYIRGSGAKEGLASGNYRPRYQTKLGDIVNSNPVFVGRPSAGFADLSYVTFANTARTPMVYVGANDGMLHGFDANTGEEKIAFVPSKAYANLSRLTMQDYSHRFTVDGQMVAQDVKVGGSWKTYLVGGLGKGGQSLFALDVSNPNNFSEANAGSIVKWEFTDKDDRELGYVYNEPVIRKMPNGKYAALVSAGYNAAEPDGNAATSGKAHLFVIFLDGPTGGGGTWVEGTDYLKIPIGASDFAKQNALGGIGTWDIEGDGTVDYAYFGDLKGTMWRVHFKGTSPSNWTNNTNLYKLFEAKIGNKAQPITAAPHIANGPNYVGAMVIFGTGKLVEKSDITASGGGFTISSMYGILDRFSSTTTVASNELMEQKMLDTETVNGTRFSLLSSYIPNYTSATRTNPRFGLHPLATGPTASTQPQKGWRLDAPGSATSGERVIYSAVQSGALVVFSNAIPSAIPCEGGGSEARYALDVFTGGRARSGGFDRNGDDAINAADTSTFSYQSGTGSQPIQFFSSRREQSGGYGQVTILSQSAGQGGTAGQSNTASSSCNRALAYSSVGDQPDRLPGGCAARIQWREALN